MVLKIVYFITYSTTYLHIFNVYSNLCNLLLFAYKQLKHNAPQYSSCETPA